MIRRILLGALLLSSMPLASAGVIDFDQFALPDSNTLLAGSRGNPFDLGQGMQVEPISGTNILISEAYNAEWARGVSSGPNAFGTTGEASFSLQDGSLFDFLGAYVTPIYHYKSIWMVGLVDNVVVDRLSFSSGVGDGRVVNAGFLAVDEVRIGSRNLAGGSGWLGIDDFEFSVAVPEPAVGWLLLTGLVGVATGRRLGRRR